MEMSGPRQPESRVPKRLNAERRMLLHNEVFLLSIPAVHSGSSATALAEANAGDW
jgi:hypothetical protein